MEFINNNNELVEPIIKDFTRKKRLIKIIFTLLFAAMVISNVIIAWALPLNEVECAKDIVLEFFNTTFSNFNSYKALHGILIVLFLFSDIIFLYTCYKYILCVGKLKFVFKLIALLLIKVVADYVFYQNNIYGNTNTYEKYLNFSLTIYMNKNDSSLFSLAISLNFLCLLENYKDKTTSNIFKKFLIINLIFTCVYFLFSNMIFSFQMLFSFLIVDYINKVLGYIN